MVDRLVVIGGDAAGMSAASQARRRQPYLEIVALERGGWTSYSACGIPYHVAGDVDDLSNLVARTPEEFRDRQRIDVRLHHEVMGIDLDGRKLEVRDHARERTISIGFDQLMVGTGARPLRPDLPGIDLDGVRGVQTLDDASALLAYARQNRSGDVVVVGGGYIGLEMAEAFLRRGAKVTVIEAGPQLMRTLDPDMGAVVTAAMRRMGVEVRLETRVTGFEPGKVDTENGPVDADLVILGLGVTPNSALAEAAGIELGVRGAIHVNQRMQTSADGVYAAGDCVDTFHLVSRRHVHIPLGTHANKQGRVAGINLGGGYATFPGVVGTAITRICDTEIARTGLTEAEADAEGFRYQVVKIEGTTRAHYFPGKKEILVKVLAEEVTGRLLGAQIIGQEGAAKRIDVLATALTAGMSVHEMIDLDLAYAPPFSPVWDPVLVAARKAVQAVDEARGSLG
jgi:NADPH-dependent 2,4-dienoyl-CoA reductase/sulfur reductase-like enzyme